MATQGWLHEDCYTRMATRGWLPEEAYIRPLYEDGNTWTTIEDDYMRMTISGWPHGMATRGCSHWTWLHEDGYTRMASKDNYTRMATGMRILEDDYKRMAARGRQHKYVHTRGGYTRMA
jgi:hypothetical protein